MMVMNGEMVYTDSLHWLTGNSTYHFKGPGARNDKGVRTACGLRRDLKKHTEMEPKLIPPERRCPKNGCKQMFTTAQIEAGY